MDTIATLADFFSSSAKRQNLLEEIINSEGVEIDKCRLKRVCQTRFVERHDSILNVVQLIPFADKALQKMIDWESRETRVTAQALSNAISPLALSLLWKPQPRFPQSSLQSPVSSKRLEWT